jgi:hypothetical protein
MGGLSRLLLVPAVFFAVNADAGEIYRWVDEQGIVHFSDTMPADNSKVESLYVGKTNPPDYDPSKDPYSITNQAERIGENWSRLEEERQARRDKRREELPREPVYAYPPYDPYYDRYRFPHYRPGLRPPSSPGYRPPLQGPTVRRQVTALDTLGLSGARPHSINSGRHAARVENSTNFIDTIRNAPPRPVPLKP